MPRSNNLTRGMDNPTPSLCPNSSARTSCSGLIPLGSHHSHFGSVEEEILVALYGRRYAEVCGGMFCLCQEQDPPSTQCRTSSAASCSCSALVSNRSGLHHWPAPSQGHTVVLTVVDCFSKAAHFIPLNKLPSSKETADALVHQVFCLHGTPNDIVSDRGPTVCI